MVLDFMCCLRQALYVGFNYRSHLNKLANPFRQPNGCGESLAEYLAAGLTPSRTHYHDETVAPDVVHHPLYNERSLPS